MAEFASLRILRTRRMLLSAILVAALLGTIATGLFVQRALSGQDPNTIMACVNRYNGQVRIPSNGMCISSLENPLEWNQEGIEGQPGPQGPQGEQGPQGLTGSLDNLFPQESVSALCNPGDDVTGGGYEFVYDQDGFVPPIAVSDRPYEDIGADGWLLTVFTVGAPVTADVYVICLDESDNTYIASERHEIGGNDEGDGGDGGDGGDNGR